MSYRLPSHSRISRLLYQHLSSFLDPRLIATLAAMVAADRRMFSCAKLEALKEKGLHFVIGAWLKSMKVSEKEAILHPSWGKEYEGKPGVPDLSAGGWAESSGDLEFQTGGQERPGPGGSLGKAA